MLKTKPFVMKKLFFILVSILISLSSFAQKTAIEDFMDNKINEETLSSEIVKHFQQYDLNKDQLVKIEAMAQRKASNYGTIKSIRLNDEKLFRKKMKGQNAHTIDYVKFILDEKQYMRFMMDYRIAHAEQIENRRKNK